MMNCKNVFILSLVVVLSACSGKKREDLPKDSSSKPSTTSPDPNSQPPAGQPLPGHNGDPNAAGLNNLNGSMTPYGLSGAAPLTNGSSVSGTDPLLAGLKISGTNANPIGTLPNPVDPLAQANQAGKTEEQRIQDALEQAIEIKRLEHEKANPPAQTQNSPPSSSEQQVNDRVVETNSQVIGCLLTPSGQQETTKHSSSSESWIVIDKQTSLGFLSSKEKAHTQLRVDSKLDEAVCITTETKNDNYFRITVAHAKTKHNGITCSDTDSFYSAYLSQPITIRGGAKFSYKFKDARNNTVQLIGMVTKQDEFRSQDECASMDVKDAISLDQPGVKIDSDKADKNESQDEEVNEDSKEETKVKLPKASTKK